MKTLLRSALIADPTDDTATHLENFRVFDSSGLQFDQPEDTAIWNYTRDFTLQHHHLPEIATIQAHFERTREDAVVDRVMEIRTIRPRTRGDFLTHLDAKAEDRRKVLIGKLLQEAGEIVTRGITIEEGKGKHKEKKILQGPVDAIKYLLDGAHAIVTPTTGSKLSGNVTYDGTDFLSRYDRVKADPNSGVGQHMGIEQVDSTLGGAKRFELWTHAAFTGGLKSTLALNWAYNQAVYFKHDVLYFSLEMPYDQCRNILYAIHSAHDKFQGIHAPLDYGSIRDGLLDTKSEFFLREHVVPDLNQKDQYGSILIEVADSEKDDFTVADIRHRAETLYAKHPFKMIFIDHALLVAPRHWVSSTTERLNEVIRDCKKLAMGFNKGAGTAVVILFQISREGYKAALKARGLDREPGKERGGAPPREPSNYVYNLSHLSYANECERSSDIVTATWIDEGLSKEGRVLLQCLKSRDQKPFDPCFMSVLWPCRRLITLKDPTMGESKGIGDNIDLTE